MGGFGKKYKTKLGCEKYFVGQILSTAGVALTQTPSVLI
jgi:hypothetical protein